MSLCPRRGVIAAIFVCAASCAAAAETRPGAAEVDAVGGHEPWASDGTFVGRSERVGRVSPSFAGRPPIGAPLDGRAEVPERLESADELQALLALPAMGPPLAAPPETIIGPDDRKRVTPTTAFPARATVLLTFSEGRCTGWLIGPDTVATAGHCVHSGGPGGHWRSGVAVYPGRNGGTSPYGSCTARRLHAVAGWIENSDDRYDYGAIKLNCSIGLTTGWYGMFWQKGPLVGLPAEINGYPGDKPLTQWRSADEVRVSEALRLFYRNDTIGGMSGSPVWTKRGTPCPICVMAVHAYGTYGAPPFARNNHGTRITKPVFDNLTAWSDAP
jgi:glutamyl endopeptidase